MDWLPAMTPRDTMLLRAAKQQHRIAQHVRAESILRGLSTAQLAKKATLHPDTVRAILNGSKHATLAVLSVLSDAAGLRLIALARPPGDDPDTPPTGEAQ